MKYGQEKDWERLLLNNNMTSQKNLRALLHWEDN